VVLRMDDVTMQEVQEVHARQTQQMHLLRNLVRSLANDFNNVLGAISGTLSLLRYSLPDETAQTEEFSGHFATMEGAMERAAIMVRQMTALAGEPDAVLQPMDVGERLRHVLNVVRNNLPGGIQLRAELPKGRALVKAHDRLLEQVVINLVDNAVASINEVRRSVGDDAEQGLLTVQMDPVIPDHEFRNRQPQATAASYWAIHVGDSGTGMTPDVVARIFEPFFTTKTVTRSAGLGLALVGEIVERLGGFIEVRSSPGKGTIFSVYIPELADVNDFLTREAAVAEGAVASDGGIPMGSGLILVVDDEPVMRKTAANILAKLGYEVVVAEGGREAVAIFRQRRADIALVMLDLAMPEMGGKETFLAMREIDPSVQALMASGYQQDELVDEALQIGIAGFIRKPYRLSTLAKEIDRIRRLGTSR
jgi:nitrogen-specific signal transduction histidine kinase/CheY-like chemotaxis protein